MRVINPLKPTSCKIKCFEDDGVVVVIVILFVVVGDQGEVLRDGDSANAILLEICDVLMLCCKGCRGLDGHVVDDASVALLRCVEGMIDRFVELNMLYM